jgi:GR25 family glycosyltransferase involved in LPS biosynthesis
VKLTIKYLDGINKLTNKTVVDNNLSKFKLFNDAFLINLDSRPDRLKYCTEELSKTDIKFNRVKGLTFKNKGNFLNVGARGCYETHKLILNNNINNNYPILIMEDDILLTEHFDKFNNYINTVPENWDILYFYNHNNIKNTINDKWIKSSTLGTHFYIVNNKSIYKILKLLYENNIDDVYSNININKFCTSNQLVAQNYKKFDSDINTSIKYHKWSIYR